MNENLRWAWHPQRGRRQLARLKPGWVWLDDVKPKDRKVKPLVKAGVRVRRLR